MTGFQKNFGSESDLVNKTADVLARMKAGHWFTVDEIIELPKYERAKIARMIRA